MTLLDLQLFTWFNATVQTPLWRIAIAIVFSNYLPALLVLLLAGIAVWRPAWRQTLWAALISLLVAWLAVHVFRAWLPMPRPAMLDIGIQWLPQGERPGFPSMHAAGAFAVATSVLLTRGIYWGAAYLAGAALISLSRVYLGMHFPTDILVGALLGSAIALTVAWTLARQQRAQRLRHAVP